MQNGHDHVLGTTWVLAVPSPGRIMQAPGGSRHAVRQGRGVLRADAT